MHYTVEFTGTRAEQYKQALKATREYLGKKRYDLLIAAIRGAEGRITQRLKTAYFYAGFVGVRGRTVVHALFKHAMDTYPVPE